MEDERVHTFSNGISPKFNIKPWLEFELANYDIAIQHVNHHTMETSPTTSWYQYDSVTVVEGESKAPFSIATTPWCRGGRYSFPWIPPLYPWYIPYIAEC